MRFCVILFLLIFPICPSAFTQTRHNANVSLREEAVKIASSLDDKVLTAQVLLAGIDGKKNLAPAMRVLLKETPVGGIMLFKYNLDSSKEDVKKLLSETANLVIAGAGIPPFMTVDHEGGLVHRFGAGIERLPSAFSFWELAQRESWYAALSRAEVLYRRSAKEIRELGITMVLGPVTEILDNDNRLFLDTRSYGPDPDFVQAAASVFIKSMDSAGIASVLKHFPGNGATDPHSGVSSIRANKAALDKMVKPFAGIIRSLEPQALMVSHVIVPALDSQRNASFSRAVIQGWLRGELGFEGIALADDFSMGAVAASGLGPGASAIDALNAGVDMIMVWPKDLAVVHAAILEALRRGRLSRSRLQEAAGRIIAGKLRCGLLSKERF
jgi:beta-N-acetylhexosaminidase